MTGNTEKKKFAWLLNTMLLKLKPQNRIEFLTFYRSNFHNWEKQDCIIFCKGAAYIITNNYEVETTLLMAGYQFEKFEAVAQATQINAIDLSSCSINGKIGLINTSIRGSSGK